MKIAIPVDEGNIDSAVCVSFGRTPFFLLYDTESGEAVFIENAAAEAQGGAGIKAAQTVVDAGANALLTVRCGQNAAEVLNAAQIGIFKTVGSGAWENLAAFKAGKLSPMTEFHAGFHGKQ
ncbi:MAG: NifB/NifX family molybdenum-iron cluster-binding protein [Oscillospiraceae bacterium]